MSENNTANDYALAKVLNNRVIEIFTLVIDNRSTPDTTAVNRSYVLLIDQLRQIYGRQPELQKIGLPICWKILDNLEQAHEFVPAIEFTHSGSDYGEDHNSSVSRLCITANIDKPVFSPQIEKLVTEADNNISVFKSELDKMHVTLSVEEISGRPVVIIGDEKYRLSAMREGLVLTVISYCLAKHPNEQVDLATLKSEIKESGLSAHGLSNLKESIRNSSHFGMKKPLRPFVDAYPKAILVRKTTELNDEQINAIKVAGS